MPLGQDGPSSPFSLEDCVKVIILLSSDTQASFSFCPPKKQQQRHVTETCLAETRWIRLQIRSDRIAFYWHRKQRR
jgi:hypothetical protein